MPGDETNWVFRLGTSYALDTHIFRGITAAESMTLYRTGWVEDWWGSPAQGGDWKLLKLFDDFNGATGLDFELVKTADHEPPFYTEHRIERGRVHHGDGPKGTRLGGRNPPDPAQWSLLVVIILTFARKRTLNPFEVHFLLSWLNQFEENFTLSDYKISPLPAYVLYTEFDSERELWHMEGYDNGSYAKPGVAARFVSAGFLPEAPETGGSGGDLSVEADFPVPVFPFFPKWNKDIIEKFHRSTDPDMKEYAKALDDWIVSMENIIKGG